MATNIDDLTKQALALPGETRAQLADILVESLEAADLGHIQRLWLSEAKRRRDEVRSGTTDTVAGEDAIRQIRDFIRK
ncbi:MAG: hypothetical protein DMF69_15180 [Acidobacteria bacterium]|nr:MAG: hypothetical protein DMF69_15180 [Acidobacteriota bacterium]